MNDSDLTASELQKKYHKGGSAQDDELTSAQLRARHGIAPNKKGYITTYNTWMTKIFLEDFSTSSNDNDKSGIYLIAAIIVAVVALGIIFVVKGK
jgi:hypothetical protein